jgi:flagellar protein FlaJ
LLWTLVAALALVLFGALSRDIGVVGNMVIFATFLIAAPQLFLRYEKYREIREMEERLPQFLRDLTENVRSGLPLHKAISTASKFEYGALSKEVKKMAHQISWGMPVNKVLDKFAERVKNSKRLSTAIKIVRESYESGGNLVSTLESVTESTSLLREAQSERKSLLNQYVLLMYAISLIFTGIVSVINQLLLPIFETSAQAEAVETLGFQNPCTAASELLAVSVCNFYKAIAQYVFSLDPVKIGAYYTSLFFIMALIQSIFSGLVAGQISEGSILAGIKHSLILFGITLGAFSILIRLGFLGV